MLKRFISIFLVMVMLLIFSAITPAWTMKQAKLMTDWASQVNSSNPLPEYPRPQLVRTDWQNLNGIWQFKQGAAGDPVPVGQNLGGEILVPYPVESAISGVMQHYDRLWYRRTFTVPTAWSGKKIRLNFGAIDWESQIYINGTSVGIHKGGYDPFSYDITSYLVGTGAQELIVRVYDPTDSGGQARGKQVNSPGGIWYTPTTGIWQTVWLEPAPSTSVSNLKIVSDLDNNRLKLTVNTSGSTSGITVSAVAKDGTTTVGSVNGNPGTELYINITSPKLWSPDNPFLYNLEVSLMSGSTTVDFVTSYFGMRKIQRASSGGYQKLLLNNQFVFQIGPLDQGFWPDGIYTAPTDAALKWDIEMEKQFGYNMVRKHVKVEPLRWYYWADKLGLLVWQDMPSGNNSSATDKTQFEVELQQLVQTHWNSPSIIMWVVFNEGWGQYDTDRLTNWVMGLDPSRIVNCASGWTDYEVGHVKDSHSYPNPSCPTSSTRAKVNGEYGGIAYAISGHMWDPNSWGYTTVYSSEDLTDLYGQYTSTEVGNFKNNSGLSAAVYTQITDVEVEINGLITYDRKVTKPIVQGIYNANHFAYVPMFTYRTVVPTSESTGQSWKYTTSTPASNWYTTSFSDSAWTTGTGGFGTSGTPGAVVRTTWNTANIWLRRTFNPGSLTAQQRANLIFRVHHDEDCEIYINGVLAASATGYTSAYGKMTMNTNGQNAIVANGNNVLAVHCKQTSGGQYIDVGIQEKIPASTSFSDNFDDGNANGWTTYAGTWSVVSGQYTVGAYAGAKSVADSTNFSNFTIEGDISVGSTGNAGLIFRVTNPSVGADSFYGYYAGIDSGNSRIQFGKMSNNWTEIATYSMTFTANTMYHMKVVANGTNIKIYVTDMNTPKIDRTDSTHTGGSIGVRTYQAAAKFDNISVY